MIEKQLSFWKQKAEKLSHSVRYEGESHRAICCHVDGRKILEVLKTPWGLRATTLVSFLLSRLLDRQRGYLPQLADATPLSIVEPLQPLVCFISHVVFSSVIT
jgi:hypothetical protein